jgi:cytoskeletal protein RodZ
MIDLGRELREAREAQGISLEQAEAATRIKQRYLEALEVNDWAALPTPVQARGFLRNYALYLGLDADQVMSHYSQTTRSAAVSLPLPAAADSPVRTTNQNGTVFRPRDIEIEHARGLPAWLSSDILLGVALALVVALMGFGLLSLLSGEADDTSAAVTATPGLSPGIATSLPPATGEAGSSQGEGSQLAVTPTFDSTLGTVQLNLEATEHVWVRVTVDGVQVLEGILAPEVPQTWQATQQIMLETANGAGLDAVVNGQPQGSLGERGQAVLLAWGPDGQIPVTPTTVP